MFSKYVPNSILIFLLKNITYTNRKIVNLTFSFVRHESEI